jgi:putative flippase GtrA
MTRPTTIALAATLAETRAGRALRHPPNWMQLAKFCTVGASGYAVNLAVYASLVELVGIHYLVAAVCSFLVAVTNNYTWNRLWTFRHQRGHVAYQGMRFLVVSVVALAANLVCLRLLVALGLGKIVAQAIAIVLVTPLNFVGNKLWSFRRKS